MPRMKNKVEIDGKRLRRRRIKNGMSQNDLAEKAQISRSYLSELELEVKTPGFRVASAIADALNMEVVDLVLDPADPFGP